MTTNTTDGNSTADDRDGKPPCGIYRTTRAIEERVPEGALVYYHNHGDPGPGVYPVERWAHNLAVFSKRGVLVPDAEYEQSLVPLPAEGFYRVTEDFYCCEKKCRLFETDTLVQLGYDGAARAILFIPVVSEAAGLSLPDKGTRVGEERLDKLAPLKVARQVQNEPESPPTTVTEPPGGGYLH